MMQSPHHHHHHPRRQEHTTGPFTNADKCFAFGHSFSAKLSHLYQIKAAKILMPNVNESEPKNSYVCGGKKKVKIKRYAHGD